MAEPARVSAGQVEGRINYLGAMSVRPRFYAVDYSRDNLVIDGRTMSIGNARISSPPPSLDREGFTLVPHGSPVSEFRDMEAVQRVYLPEVERLMLGLTGATLPTLNGYVSTAPRPRAVTALTSDRGDPLLAYWQQGLGRVVAWTSDTSGPWSQEWRDWSEGEKFWQQAVRWTFPEPTRATFPVTAEVVGDQVTLRAQSVRPDGRFGDLLDTRVTITPPGGLGVLAETPIFSSASELATPMWPEMCNTKIGCSRETASRSWRLGMR